MKRLAMVMILVFGSCLFLGAQELSKSEKKNLIAQIKKLKKNPALYKQMQTDLNELKADASQVDARLQDVRDQLEAAQQEAEESKIESEKLKAELASLNTQLSSTKEAAQTRGFLLPETGIVFRVQIGGYRNIDMKEFVDNSSENIQVETNDAGINEITVGQFTSYWKADTMKKYLRIMGVKDSFIVPYRDGKRVEIKDILGEVETRPGTSGN